MPRAFAMCTDMDYITIDNGIKEICRAAFAGCSSVETAYIGDGSCDNLVIGDRAFAECTSLKSVIIGDDVHEIHKNAFYGCDFDNLTIYSDSEYVKNYCEENGIKYEER
jgi:xanthine dehydrogenase molybdopterin-binding subunit B